MTRIIAALAPLALFVALPADAQEVATGDPAPANQLVVIETAMGDITERTTPGTNFTHDHKGRCSV